MEVLHCYNPHRTGRFSTIQVLQGCYGDATGCYNETISGRRPAGQEIRKPKAEGRKKSEPIQVVPVQLLNLSD